MPARSIDHDAVREALTADGWTITADPQRLFVGQRRLYVDLAGERASLAAERGGERIAVEVQRFVSPSRMDAFHRAVGQFVVYRAVLRRSDPDRTLFLAIPDRVYDNGLFSEPLGQLVVADVGIRLIVYRASERGIVRWTS